MCVILCIPFLGQILPLWWKDFFPLLLGQNTLKVLQIFLYQEVKPVIVVIQFWLMHGYQAPVVQGVWCYQPDNHCPVDTVICFANIFTKQFIQADSVNPPLKQLGPGPLGIKFCHSIFTSQLNRTFTIQLYQLLNITSSWLKFFISQIPPLPPKPVTTVSAAEAKSKKQLGQLSGESTLVLDQLDNNKIIYFTDW